MAAAFQKAIVSVRLVGDAEISMQVVTGSIQDLESAGLYIGEYLQKEIDGLFAQATAKHKGEAEALKARLEKAEAAINEHKAVPPAPVAEPVKRGRKSAE